MDFVLCVQGLAFLPKTECNVRDVEIAVGLMLTKTTIEPVAFRAPRVKVRQLNPLANTTRNTVYCFFYSCLLLTNRTFFIFGSPERVLPG